MFLLYPRLSIPIAEKLYEDISSSNISDLVNRSATFHPSVQYAPTGGSRVTSEHLKIIQNNVRACAQKLGYPNAANDELSRRFDVECGILLHRQSRIHPSEASHLEVWTFFTCILLPDIVRWRFPGERTALERFIGKDRGLRRNTLGRLWWRAYLLNQPKWEKPYRLLYDLYEDDLVQVTERNIFAADPLLLTSFSIAFLNAVKLYSDVPRRMLIREASKRLRRLISFVYFETIDIPTKYIILEDIFGKTAQAIRNAPSLEAAQNDPYEV